MGQKVNPISLRLPTKQKTYSDCWYSASNYTKLLHQKLKMENYMNAILQQKGLPEAQISLSASSKSQRYLVCMFDPTESRLSKSTRYKVRQPASKPGDYLSQNVATSSMSQQRLLNTPTLDTKSVIKHAVKATLAKTAKDNTFVSKYMTSVMGHSTNALKSNNQSVSPLTKAVTSYTGIPSTVTLWSSAWESQHADFVAQEIALALMRRVPFRAIKMQLIKELEENYKNQWASVRGLRVMCSGRGSRKSKKAQRAQTLGFHWGQTSLHVFSEKVGFAKRASFTSFGKVGIKVWICYK